jgi:hypothetical protein
MADARRKHRDGTERKHVDDEFGVQRIGNIEYTHHRKHDGNGGSSEWHDVQ